MGQAGRSRPGQGRWRPDEAEREELTRLRRENRKLKEEREILSKAAAWFATEKPATLEALFGFVKANQATHSVRDHVPTAEDIHERLLCLGGAADVALGSGPISGAHGAHSRDPPPLARDVWLAEDPCRAGRRSRHPRGSQARGAADARGGLRGATLRKFVVTTQRRSQSSAVADLVERRFYAERPNRLWVADATYIPTWSGFLYLAIVLDVFSRKIVGWAMETHLRTELMLAAIDMAITMRRPEAVIHHSDHGCQGDFQWSSQHLAIGGVAWDDQRVGLQSGQDVRRCGRRVGRASTSGMPSRRSGRALRRELQVRMRHWRAACRSRLARAGSARPVGWRRSVWLRSQDDFCRSVSARSWRY